MLSDDVRTSHAKLVSVVIPCRNEERYIESCVLSVLASDYPSVEIFVVDGMSTDGTRERLRALEQKYPQVRVVDNERQLTPFAFNLGIRASHGEFIQITGARNILAPDYISKLVEVLDRDQSVACVGGDCEHIYDSEEGRWISSAMESRFGVGGSNFRTLESDAYVDTVGIPLFRRKIFDEIGYFDEQLTRNQDDDFSFRLTQAGHKIYYRHDAKVTYMVRASYAKAFNQYFQYGYFKVFVNKKHRTVTTLRQLVPLCFVAFLSFGLIASVVVTALWIPYLAILVLYFLMGYRAAGEFTQKFTERLVIQKSIFILHTGYGLGYFRGLVDFILLGKKPSQQLQKQTT